MTLKSAYDVTCESVTVVDVSVSKDIVKKKQDVFVSPSKKKTGCSSINCTNIICYALGFIFTLPFVLGIVYVLGMGIVKGITYCFAGASDAPFPMDEWYTHVVFMLVGVVIPACCCCYCMEGTCRHNGRFSHQERY